jgi:hypothetical protein
VRLEAAKAALAFAAVDADRAGFLLDLEVGVALPDLLALGLAMTLSITQASARQSKTRESPWCDRPAFLLEASDSFADRGLNFALDFHRAVNAETLAKMCSTFPKSTGLIKWWSNPTSNER